MSQIKFDLATKYIPTDQKVWAIHAGKHKKFYSIFLEGNMVFLEYPGLNISIDALEDATRIKQHIKMSNALSEYLRKGGTSAPSRNPSTYVIEDADDKALKADMGNVRNLY